MINTLPTPPNRGPWQCPYGQNLWEGNVCAVSLYDQPYQKYYCTINVVCSQFDYNESFTWSNNSGTNGTMNIDVPTNGSFTIFVEYYEPCGTQWATGSYGRGKWATMSGVLGYSSGIVLGSWYYVRKELC